jgi:hypothetical protein
MNGEWRGQYPVASIQYSVVRLTTEYGLLLADSPASAAGGKIAG